MKARMRRTSASIDVTFAEQSGSDEALHYNNSKSLDIAVSESRIDRMRKLLSSPLLRRKPNSGHKSSPLPSCESRIFGVPLEYLSHENSKLYDEPFIPSVVSRLCHFIEDSGGLKQEGLFRISGNVKMIDKLKHSFDTTGDAPLETEGDIASASALLKLFLRELPQPLIADSTPFLDAIKNYNDDNDASVYNIRSLVSRLPDANFYTLKYLSNFLNRIALQKENRMTSANLGIVFAPNIFRVCVDNFQGLREQSFANEVVSLFITNSDQIFSVDTYPDLIDNSQNSLCPLTVEIPDLGIDHVLAPVSSNYPKSEFHKEIPALLVHCSENDNHSNRKRKESKRDVNSPPLRSNSEEMLFQMKDKEMRRCSSHEDIVADPFVVAVNKFENLNFSNSSSPHPPEAKRRELDTSVSHNFDQNNKQSERQFDEKIGIFSVNDKSHNDDKHRNVSNEMKENDYYEENNKFDKQNIKNSQSIYTSDERNSRPLLEITPSENDNNKNNVKSESGYMGSKKHSIDAKMFDLSEKIPQHLDFKTIYHNPDLFEPILSEHRYSWPRTSQEMESQDHNVETPSGSISQFLKKANSLEAPLSPSAYRSYLSNRSIHLDPSIPPSPPVEQMQIFTKIDITLTETTNTSIKSITKKIQSFKKKLKQFEYDFENDNGFRPSLEQKMSSPKARLYIMEMNKLKKDLKDFKEEFYMDNYDISCMTNAQMCDKNELCAKRSLSDISRNIKDIEQTLEEKRKCANRPEMLEDMTIEQINEEKLTLQKSLLRFEAIYGRPTSKAERDIVRPIYERYRTVKRLVAKSMPPKPSTKDSIELQPILEHIAMDFTSPSHSKSQTTISIQDFSDAIEGAIDVTEPSLDTTQVSKPIVKESSNQVQCNNLHEMPLSELNKLIRETRIQKRNLRTTLRNFENDFLKMTGRKVEKEDKTNMTSVYANYKNTKGKLRLLEALVSKHESH